MLSLRASLESFEGNVQVKRMRAEHCFLKGHGVSASSSLESLDLDV
jgi:hypothetical protein